MKLGISWLTVGIGAVIGFSGCSSSDPGSDAPASTAAQSQPAAGSQEVPPPSLPEVEADLFTKDSIHGWDGSRIITWYVDGGLLGGHPTVLLSQARFEKQGGVTVPLPATLEILSLVEGEWSTSLLTDPEAAVFHKAVIWNDGIVSISGGKPKTEQNGLLKYWTRAGEVWSAETLWSGRWAGEKQRLRDFEVGDVDGDDQDEMVLATHDHGVIVVLENALGEGEITATELDLKANTYVHEIEIGDIDGDGTLEFFATPSDPNKRDNTQAGEVVMYRFDGQTYKRTLVDRTEDTHAKEILAADMDGDGVTELFSAVEAVKKDGALLSDVEIRQFHFEGGEPSGHTVIGTLKDDQLRNMIAHDFDGDGYKELVLAPWKSGLFLLKSTDGKSYDLHRFEDQSAGFEHTANVLDIDGDGVSEIYVADDDKSKSLNRYSWK